MELQLKRKESNLFEVLACHTMYLLVRVLHPTYKILKLQRGKRINQISTSQVNYVSLRPNPSLSLQLWDIICDHCLLFFAELRDYNMGTKGRKTKLFTCSVLIGQCSFDVFHQQFQFMSPWRFRRTGALRHNTCFLYILLKGSKTNKIVLDKLQAIYLHIN